MDYLDPDHPGTIVLSAWDKDFVSNPTWRFWLGNQLALENIDPSQTLQAYVQHRIEVTRLAEAATKLKEAEAESSGTAAPLKAPNQPSPSHPPSPTLESEPLAIERDQQSTAATHRIGSTSAAAMSPSTNVPDSHLLATPESMDAPMFIAMEADGKDSDGSVDENVDDDAMMDVDVPIKHAATIPIEDEDDDTFVDDEIDDAPMSMSRSDLASLPSTASVARSETNLPASKTRPLSSAKKATTKSAVSSSSSKSASAVASTSRSTLDRPKSVSSSSSTKPVSTVTAIPVGSLTWPVAQVRLSDALKLSRKTPQECADTVGKILASFATDEVDPVWKDNSRVPPDGRTLVCEKLRGILANKGEFNQCIVGSAPAMTSICLWLTSAVAALRSKPKESTFAAQLAANVLPILRVLDLSPLGMEQLSIHPFARLVLRLKKNESTKPILEIVDRLIDRWTKQQEAVGGGTAAKGKAKEVAVKPDPTKRKSDAVNTVPQKKPKVEVKIPKVIIPKKEPTSAITPSTGSRSATSLIADTLAAMGRTYGAPTDEDKKSCFPKGKDSMFKKKKSVRFPVDAEMCHFKMIESRYGPSEEHQEHDDMISHRSQDEHDVSAAFKSIKSHTEEEEEEELLMETEIEYYPPFPVMLPDSDAFDHLLKEPYSENAEMQSHRESRVAEVSYPKPSQIPNSPGESLVTAGDTERGTVAILMSIELEAYPEVYNEINRIHPPAPPSFALGVYERPRAVVGGWGDAAAPDLSHLQAILDTSTQAANHAYGQRTAEYGASNYYGYNPSQPAVNAYGHVAAPSGWDSQPGDYQTQQQPSTYSSQASAPRYNQRNFGRGGGTRGGGSSSSSMQNREASGSNSTKRESCKFYHSTTGCDYGDRCRNRHG